MRKPYTPEEKLFIVKSRLAGMIWQKIADELNRKKEVVRFAATTYWFKEMTAELKDDT